MTFWEIVFLCVVFGIWFGAFVWCVSHLYDE